MASNSSATIIVPVFNSLHVVRPCFASILRWTDLSRHELVFVNDGSDEVTTDALRKWAHDHVGVSVIENPMNLGFVRSVNRAMESSSAEYVVLLNSDTCVTPRWLDKMIRCMESDARIGVASPISNFAPHMRIEMVPGLNYVEMAGLVESLSQAEYPDITTPEGFCYMVSRTCREAIGEFDVIFDDGYGEESDYAMRANYFGFRTVCADDTYIYHRGRASFGLQRRNELYEQNKSVFHTRWRNRYPSDFREFQERNPLGNLRQSVDSFEGNRWEGAYER